MRAIWVILAALLLATPALCQGTANFPVNGPTVNASAVITLGNTFQTVLAAKLDRQSLTIQNNNATDSCWIFVGATTPTKARSILLLAGGAYTRYWPYVPTDAIQATCANTSDTLYLDTTTPP